MINKFYYYYQIKGKVFWQLNFTLKKEVDFNYKIIIDILYLNEKFVFYAIDAITAF